MEPAEVRSIGHAVSVTRLGLGTAPLGGLYEAVPDGDARGAVSSALSLGIRYVDTAPLYGYGLAERRLGAALRGVERDSFTISTKVGRLVRPGGGRPEGDPYRGAPPASAVFDFSREGVLRSLEDSMRRLRLDRLDVVYVHDPDDHADAALDGAFPALLELRAGGVIGAVGAGMNQVGGLARFVEETDLDVVLCAGRYSLLDQSADRGLLRACEQRGVAVILGGVFNSGILADPSGQQRYDYRPAGAAVVARVGRLQEVCAGHAVPLRAAALQFAAAHPAVASVLVGCRSAAEVADCWDLARLPIPREMWECLLSEGLLPSDVPLPPGPLQ